MKIKDILCYVMLYYVTKGPMTVELNMQHWVHRPNKVYSNDDIGLTLTFFTARSICFHMLLYGKIYIPSRKILESHLMEETYNK